MTDLQAALNSLLPPKRKTTPSGWISFNAPCCHHRGESKDNRQRGGLLQNPTGGFQYHCFNCNFKSGWTPGHVITKNTKQLLKWLGMPESEISKFSLQALKSKENSTSVTKSLKFEIEEKNLPNNCKKITEWLEQTENAELVKIIEYILSRGFDIDWYDWMWSPENGYKDRIIIPFYYQGKVVGWTGRKITEGKPKYLTESQPGYVFNIDRQLAERKYVIVVEGQFDAIAVDGVAIMHNEPNEVQCARINALAKEVILVPDKDKPGAKMISAALENNWSVSLPPWNDGIKDVADAVKNYGRLYTLASILHYKESNELKIKLLKKKLESIHE